MFFETSIPPNRSTRCLSLDDHTLKMYLFCGLDNEIARDRLNIVEWLDD
jgi:hypothetical protein